VSKCGRSYQGNDFCKDCSESDWIIESIRSPYQFEGLTRETVHLLKYKNLTTLAKPMAELLALYLSRHPLGADLIVPIPVHSRRLKERGYNQSALIAAQLSSLVTIPYFELLKGRVTLLPRRAVEAWPSGELMLKECFPVQNHQ